MGILSETGLTSGFSGLSWEEYTSSIGSEASISSENDARHFSQPNSLLQVHSSGRLYEPSVVTGTSPRRCARISSYITELFSRIMTSSIAITGISEIIIRRRAFANAGDTSESTKRRVSCSLLRSLMSIYLSCFQDEGAPGKRSGLYLKLTRKRARKTATVTKTALASGFVILGWAMSC